MPARANSELRGDRWTSWPQNGTTKEPHDINEAN